MVNRTGVLAASEGARRPSQSPPATPVPSRQRQATIPAINGRKRRFDAPIGSGDTTGSGSASGRGPGGAASRIGAIKR